MNTRLPPAEIPEPLRPFPIVISLPLQWGDQDAFGHVNNTVPIRWFESARIAYIEHERMGDLLMQGEVKPILASVHCDYRLQLRHPDTVLVSARVSRLGGASMTMEHAVYSLQQEAVAATGSSVVVAFNYQRNRPQRIADTLREAVAEIEQRSLRELQKPVAGPK